MRRCAALACRPQAARCCLRATSFVGHEGRQSWFSTRPRPQHSDRSDLSPRAGSEGEVQISEERLQEFLRAEVHSFARREATSLTLNCILDAHSPHLSGRLTLTELPIRFAQRIIQIEALPHWRSSSAMSEVHDLYMAAFRKIRLVDVRGPGQEDSPEFTKKLNEATVDIKKQMQGVVPMLANGMRAYAKEEGLTEAQVNDWLDMFFLSRIGTEMLTSQYLACLKSAAGKGPQREKKFTGIVDDVCNPVAICQQAARHAQKLAREHSGRNVVITVEKADSVAMGNGLSFPYVPQYLFYIMLELLKNAARATAENCADPARTPVVITVGADESEVGIRVQDRAGGINFADRDRIWSYMYSTVHKSQFNTFAQDGTPLAGYGVGLPLSRIYAQYLGGSLNLMSLPGIGTSAYLHLKRIGTEAREEHLPRTWSSTSDAL